MQQPDAVLRSLQEAAQEIAAERQRLNKVFEALASAVLAYDPSATLMADGSIARGEVEIPPPPATEATEPPEQPSSDDELRPVIVYDDVKHYFVDHPERQSLTQISKALRAEKPEQVRAHLQTLTREGYLAHEGAGAGQTHYWYRATRERPKREPVDDEGAQDDVLGHLRSNPGRNYSVKELASATTLTHQAVRDALLFLMKRDTGVETGVREGDQLVYRLPTPPSSQTKSDEGQQQRPTETVPSTSASERKDSSGGTKPSSTETSQASSHSQTSDGHGLARSPRPRSHMVSHQRQSEEKMDSIVLWMNEHEGPFNASDMAEDLKESKQSFTRWLSALEERNVIKRVGTMWPRAVLAMRIARPQNSGGRPAIAWDLFERSYAEPVTPVDTSIRRDGGKAAVPPQSGGRDRASSTQPPADESQWSDDLKKVRDWAVKQKDGVSFSPQMTANGTKLKRELALALLEKLAESGIVTDQSPAPDMRLFAYFKPTSPGKAAEQEHAARKAARSASGTASEPVAGTGKGLTIGNADVRRLVQDLMRGGAKVTRATNQHFNVWKQGLKQIQIAATPSDHRTPLNDRARLRRAGYAV